MLYAGLLIMGTKVKVSSISHFFCLRKEADKCIDLLISYKVTHEECKPNNESGLGIIEVT